ncbi:MAG: 1-(5-phosphoribosyl)-5-[(5-phosphoribosylamino)methylideneamino]imidazole-4-carboxamide isomerase [Candidatus Izemoplasmatales bacterium]|nr:1-(5-phosphoribosyl)-5-[(5-phosphoribosylamino)methylideneamino]imidazole-4-carboxamide isomerase [bacterium]MDZ4195742.1 1-(5-phosphoribosyl)-5-[(5-phosphoribosylamino)methylideneamino]imidazole-4-carboxamide isomerase [Candidatus Izemoplasmatales bacterium]
MILLPAIDLYNNQCVRLTQGNFDSFIVYSNSPEQVALKFEQMGVRMLHIVDLNGAKTGEAINTPSIKKILQTVSIPIQVGGGIRSIKRASELLDMGVSRIIIGTSAIENWKLLEELVLQYREKIIVSIDAQDGIVKTRGWVTSTGIQATDLVKTLESIGIQTIVYTDISKDGMLKGPNIEMYKTLKNKSNIGIIASGGVTSLEDLATLSSLGLVGAIVGKAYYEGLIDIEEAIACLQKESSPV